MEHAGKAIDRDQRLEFESKVWERRQRGYTQARIASELSVDQGTVSRALARIYRRASARLDRLASHERCVQVEHLNLVVDEAFQAWERSKKPKKRTAKKSGGSGLGGDQITQEAQERDGDPAFLATAMQALDRLAKLLDLSMKPAAVETHSDNDLRAALLAAEAILANPETDPE